MNGKIEMGKTGELEDGVMKQVVADGREILLARVRDSFYAVDNRCPHMGGALSQGKLEGTVVTCPRHGSQFDLRDGQVVRWLKGSGLISTLGKAFKSPRAIVTYKVEVVGDRILIDV